MHVAFNYEHIEIKNVFLCLQNCGHIGGTGQEVGLLQDHLELHRPDDAFLQQSGLQGRGWQCQLLDD
jgi:hypothetical protein